MVVELGYRRPDATFVDHMLQYHLAPDRWQSKERLNTSHTINGIGNTSLLLSLSDGASWKTRSVYLSEDIQRYRYSSNQDLEIMWIS